MTSQKLHRAMPSIIKTVALCISVSIVMLFSASCASSKNGSDRLASTVSSSAALNDLASSVNQRSQIIDSVDENDLTDEEFWSHRRKLVDKELEILEKYKDQDFDDSYAGNLINAYIYGCRLQSCALDYFKDYDLYSLLWDSGYSARAAALVALYEKYDLHINSDVIGSFQTFTSYSVDTSELDDLDGFFNRDIDDVMLNQGDLKITKSVCEYESYGDSNYCFVHFTVLNQSPYDLNSISVQTAVLDDAENILGAESGSIDIICPSGKSVDIKVNVRLNEYPSIKYIRLESARYDGNGDHVVYTVLFDETDISEHMIEVS